MNKPPKIIYLLPEAVEDDRCFEWCWCDDPAPGVDMDKKDAVKYIRADTLGRKRKEKQE